MKAVLRIVLIVFASVAVLVAINFAPMVSLKTPAMREYTAHGLTVWAAPTDVDEVEPLAARVASQSAAVVEALDGVDASGVEIIVYPNRDALKRKTFGLAGMLMLPDWFIGRNTTDYVLIASPGEPGPAHTRESIVQASVHEYVHVMTDRRHREMGYWMKEGIALYLAGQVPDESAVRRHSDLTWAEFSSPNAMQFAEVGGYTLAYTMIEYLIDRYGWDAVVGLVDPQASYESVLGVTERELFDEWIATVRTRTAAHAPPPSSPIRRMHPPTRPA